MDVITLDKLDIGERGRVVKVGGSGDELRHRLIDMGLITGTLVETCKRAPMGDPMEIILRGYHLTLRAADAKYIELEKLK